MKVQEIIHKSIRTLSNSISNRSPDEANIALGHRMRDGSFPLVPVEEIEAELEQRWYTLEEQFQTEMMMPRENGASPLFEESKFMDGTPT